MNKFGNFIKSIEEETPPVKKEINWDYINKVKIPSLPQYKKHNSIKNTDDYYGGKLREGKQYSDGKVWIVCVRCKTCGALQWTDGWHEFNKSRCEECNAILDFNTEEERNKDWEIFWKNKSFFDDCGKFINNCLKKFFNNIADH